MNKKGLIGKLIIFLIIIILILVILVAVVGYYLLFSNQHICMGEFSVWEYNDNTNLCEEGKVRGCVISEDVFLTKQECENANIFENVNCARQGEVFDSFNSSDNLPDACCSGLIDVSKPDTISIADKCYWDGLASGWPFSGVCSDCGNGVCEDVESVCGCLKDCGAENSDYIAIQDFCDNGYDLYCNKGLSDLPICSLC
ncbi:MAG: hypothetical protein WC533_02855 [Candidatus Pacearchaeota archaeon]